MARRFTLFLFLLLALTHSAQAAGYIYIPIFIPQGPLQVPDADTGDYSGIHKVAIISTLETAMPVWNRHMGKKDEKLDISSWKLNALIESQLRGYLKDRFAVQDMDVDRAALGRVADSTSRLRKLLSGLPPTDVDAYVIVRSDGDSGSGTPGLTFKDISGLPSPEESANFSIDIRDSHSLRRIGSAFSRIQLRDNEPIGFADVYVSPDLHLRNDATLPDAEQSAQLQRDFSELLTMAVRETLRALKTGAALPPGNNTQN